MESQVILSSHASKKSIIKKTSLPLFAILTIVNILIQILLVNIHQNDDSTTLWRFAIFEVVVIVLIVVITKLVYDNTYIALFDDHMEITDMSKSYKRISTIEYSEIKSVEIKKNTLLIESNIKYKILHLVNPYEIEDFINKRLKEIKKY
jgi:membrane protein YdbS with pleckstrin-like domain